MDDLSSLDQFGKQMLKERNNGASSYVSTYQVLFMRLLIMIGIEKLAFLDLICFEEAVLSK